MKYVFYMFFSSSSAPKAAAEIIKMMKHTSGTTMLESYLQKYIDKLKSEIEKANASGRHAKIEMEHSERVDYRDNRVHGQISVYNSGQWGQKDIARLDYIKVADFWALDKNGELYIVPKSLLEKDKEGGKS